MERNRLLTQNINLVIGKGEHELVFSARDGEKKEPLWQGGNQIKLQVVDSETKIEMLTEKQQLWKEKPVKVMGQQSSIFNPLSAC